MILRDRTGRKIGEIIDDNSGVKVARDSSGQLMGEYDPSTGVTRDRSGRMVGQGDQLAALLKME